LLLNVYFPVSLIFEKLDEDIDILQAFFYAVNLNMDDDKENTETLLKAGIRKIRNIEFNYEALLQPGMKLKGPIIQQESC